MNKVILFFVMMFTGIALATTANAQDIVVLPDSGNWTIRATHTSQLDHWDALSVELRRDTTNEQVACQPTVVGESVLTFVVTASLTDTPWLLRGYAYPKLNCAGPASLPSNSATLDKKSVLPVVLH